LFWLILQNTFVMQGGSISVRMNYGTPKNAPLDKDMDWTRSDWICSKCTAHNFKRREYCFKCNISYAQSKRTKEEDGFGQVGINPCNTLIFRGLDGLTTEETLSTALLSQTGCVCKQIKVIRDDTTGTSRGFSFAEFPSVLLSQQALTFITQSLQQPFEVDGKVVMVDFAKNTFNTTMTTLNGQQQVQQQSYNSYNNNDRKDQTSTNNGQFYDYRQHQHHPQVRESNSAVAQQSIAQALAAQNYNKVAEVHIHKPAVTAIQHAQVAEQQPTNNYADVLSKKLDPADPYSQYPIFPVPDVSKYTYDETSGYYYDDQTTLYYDANTQYFYNGQTEQFLYWDGDRQTYTIPATQTDTDTSQAETMDRKDGEQEVKKDGVKKEKVKVAKKIAKEMEKWAKTLNKQKYEQKESFKKSFAVLSQTSVADAGFAVLEKALPTPERKGIDINLLRNKGDNNIMPPPMANAQPTALVASYGTGDSDEEDEDNSANVEENLIDHDKLACLLCKRQFPNKDALSRHSQLSDLHKKNLEDWRLKHATTNQGYRDRAKERRDKFGVPEPPLRRPKQNPSMLPPVPHEDPSKKAIGTENVGNRLMKKMGWSEGQGLGQVRQGRTDNVEAVHRTAAAGLGSRGSSYNVSPGSNYKDTAKKVMYARYQELNGT